MERIVKILLALVLSTAITLGEELKSRPVEFGAGSSLKIDAGVQVYALPGSIWDFTGATLRGLTRLPAVTGQSGKFATNDAASANRQSIGQSAPIGSVGDLNSKRSTFAAGAGAYYVNIKTDYGAVGDGVTSDATAFINFNTWARAQTGQIYLILPPGDYKLDNFSSQRFTAGVKKLVVEGYGASINDIYLGIGIQQNNTTSALLSAITNDLVGGTSTVTLTTLSEYTRFTAGTWVAITAYDMQTYGYPPNPYYFEFRKVVSVNSSTGQIVLDRPLLNKYSTTYPKYSQVNGSNASQGGPATLYAMHPNWDQDLIIKGLKFNSPVVYGSARSITYVDCSFKTLPSPSVSLDVTHTNCTYHGTARTEVDKMVSLLRYDNVMTKTLDFQSASIENCIISSCRLDELSGTAKHQVVENTNITDELRFGSLGYGDTQNLIINNCQVNSFVPTIQPATGANSSTFSNGTFTFLKSSFLTNVFTPGRLMLLTAGSNNYALPFRITNIREDGTHVFVDTTLPATINVPLWSVVTHPCPSVTVQNSRGCQDVLNMSNDPIKGRPFGSYASYHLTGGSFGSSATSVPRSWILGNLVKLRVNVIRPYTGTLSSLNLHLEDFGVKVLSDANGSSVTAFDPVINLKIAGERVIMPGRTTGKQSGDSNINIGNYWICPYLQPYLGPGHPSIISSENETVWPIVDVELTTDQGIVAVESVISGKRRVRK